MKKILLFITTTKERVLQKKENRFSQNELMILLFLLVLFVAIVIRTAWLSDDSYITFRTVDNFVNGYGLRWNITERVQSFTHPLWMFLIAGLYAITHEMYFTALGTSLVISAIAFGILLFKTSHSVASALLAGTILIFSKAFIDYSTSGLENPLSYLLLALFFLVYQRYPESLKKLFLLSLLAGLAVLNRMDTLLFFIPPLLYSYVITKQWVKGIAVGILGFLPFFCWEIFSLFYYGFLFPNTAYAKLNIAIPIQDFIQQGITYYLKSLSHDPLTLCIIFFVLITSWYAGTKNKLMMLGVLLYLLYVVRIGGDFMSGRFFAVPLFIATLVLSTYRLQLQTYPFYPLFAFVVILGLFASPLSPLQSAERYDVTPLDVGTGIADERSFYYQNTGLLKYSRGTVLPNHPWSIEGIQTKESGETLREGKTVGFLGFSAGPTVHIVDVLGLNEPLMARLYVEHPELLDPTGRWRIGHFFRPIPEGYMETLATGENVIADKKISRYYDVIAHITRGDLFEWKRIQEIWRINTGTYDYLLK